MNHGLFNIDKLIRKLYNLDIKIIIDSSNSTCLTDKKQLKIILYVKY